MQPLQLSYTAHFSSWIVVLPINNCFYGPSELTLNRASCFHFVPALLLLNTMSLAPKIDEIAYTIKQKNLDLALFTETGLKSPYQINRLKLLEISYFGEIVRTEHTEVFVRSLKILLNAKHC